MSKTGGTLPCIHREEVKRQVKPTIHLLNNLDSLYPQVLLENSIQPQDYKGSLVFRSAVESIRGTFIASSTVQRQGLVASVLEQLKSNDLIEDFKATSASNRFDFDVQIESDPDYFVTIEVKGGEGNSINISQRPIWAKEFCLWSHLDGAIVNQPAYGARAIINRVTNEMVRRQKRVDAVFFKDVLCGTRLRPCPKYPGQEDVIHLKAAPDIFLFPVNIPSVEEPEPPVRTFEELKLPRLILELFGIPPEQFNHHIWYVRIKLVEKAENTFFREVSIYHQDKLVEQSRSRSWVERKNY